MATFINVRTTEVGQALLAQVHAGSEELTITGIAFGSGAWTEEEYAERNLTALNNEVMRVAPSGGRQSGGAADITCVLTNVTLDEGFALTELGVIAEKKDGSEVLYMADCVPPVKSTWISAKDEYRIEIPVTLRIKCSSNSTVEIRVESTVPVTNEDLENHNTASNAHHDIRELLRTHTHTWSVITGKPSVFPPAGHTHTPNQVGLSNLPNAKSDSVTSTSSNSLATSKAVKIAYDKGKQALDLAGQKAASNHNHNSVYAPKTHVHSQYLESAGGSMAGTLNFNGSWISMENGDHWITNNDGKGNFNIRVGHDPAEKYTQNSGAIHLGFSHEISEPSFTIRMSPKGVDNVVGEAVDFSEAYTFGANGKFSFNGNRFFGKHFLPSWDDVTNKPTLGVHGGCIWFDGTVNSAGRPIDAKTGQPDNRYGVCDGRTYTAPDGRQVATINARDRFIVTAGGKYSKGSTGGAERVTTSISQMPSHKHSFENNTSNVDASAGRIVSGGENTGQSINETTMNTAGASQSHENRPPYVGLFLIKFL